jgi:TRAP-type C4-dicarboxylate transport system permease small subunit
MAGGIGIMIMMLYITCDVFGRYLFGKPLPVSFEIAEMLMIFVVFSALAYVHVRRGHLRLTFLFRRMSPRGQLIADILALVIGIFIFSIITWQAADWAIYALKTNEYRLGVIRIPYFPPRFMLAIGAGLATIEFFVDLVGRIRQLLSSGGAQDAP